jgi:hypothetical protein
VALADCLVGSWTADGSSLEELIKSAAASVGGTAAEATPTGSSTTTFAKGGTFTTDVNLKWDLKVTVDGKAKVGYRAATGEQQGTWTVDGVELISTVTEDGVKATDGEKVDGKDEPPSDTKVNSVDGVLPTTPMSATCDATTFTLTKAHAAATVAAERWIALMPHSRLAAGGSRSDRVAACRVDASRPPAGRARSYGRLHVRLGSPRHSRRP